MKEAYEREVDMIPLPDSFIHLKEFGLTALLKDFLARLRGKKINGFDEYTTYV